MDLCCRICWCRVHGGWSVDDDVAADDWWQGCSPILVLGVLGLSASAMRIGSSVEFPVNTRSPPLQTAAEPLPSFWLFGPVRRVFEYAWMYVHSGPLSEVCF